MESNVHYVNNTGANIAPFFSVFAAAYESGELHEDFSDIFKINFLANANEDGSARMIIEAA